MLTPKRSNLQVCTKGLLLFCGTMEGGGLGWATQEYSATCVVHTFPTRYILNLLHGTTQNCSYTRMSPEVSLNVNVS